MSNYHILKKFMQTLLSCMTKEIWDKRYTSLLTQIGIKLEATLKTAVSLN